MPYVMQFPALVPVVVGAADKAEIHFCESLIKKHTLEVVVAATEVVGVVVAAAEVVDGGIGVVGAAKLVDGVETAVVTVVVEGSVVDSDDAVVLEGSVVVDDSDDNDGGGSDGYVGLKGVVAAEIVGDGIRLHAEFVDLFNKLTGHSQENVK